jgi:hypothetical protein
MPDNELRDFAIWIVQITEHSNPCHTGGHTGRLFPFFDKLDTESTFFYIAFLLNDPNIIGTGGNAILTANTFILIHKNDPIFSFVGGPCGANLYTWRIVAMLALNR